MNMIGGGNLDGRGMQTGFNNLDVNNQVSNFVEGIRRDVQGQGHDTLQGAAVAMGTRRPGVAVNEDELQEVQRRSERAIVEAKKFKASIEAPSGMNDNHDNLVSVNNNQVDEQILHNMMAQQQNMHSEHLPDIGNGLSDDDFFHLTCFIDPSLIHKIEKGEFVDLEKLLPKDKIGAGREDRFEWVQREGGTFLVPAHKENRISGIRRWEQAFRVYATIYCGANPHRGKEIWQYISVINTAAAAYTWDNVYSYDITFRHLMAFNPNRSWAVTYNQMWNLSMRDRITKFHSGSVSKPVCFRLVIMEQTRDGVNSKNQVHTTGVVQQVGEISQTTAGLSIKVKPVGLATGVVLLKDVATMTLRIIPSLIV